MTLINKIGTLSILSISIAFATNNNIENNTTNMLSSMAGVWSANCYKMPNGKYASRTVNLKANGDVIGDMTIFKDSNCTKEIKKVHKEYTMKLGKKSVADDKKEAYEVKKIGKNGWVVYSMIRMQSPTVIIPAERTKDRNGSTLKLRANHFTEKSIKCTKEK
jgi:hypothetical protein